MSFNFQGPSEMPMIQSAQNMQNNGGGGNLGYFQRGKKKKENERTKLFGSNDEEDSFSLSSNANLSTDENTDDEQSSGKGLKGFLEKVINKLQDEK